MITVDVLVGLLLLILLDVIVSDISYRVVCCS